MAAVNESVGTWPEAVVAWVSGLSDVAVMGVMLCVAGLALLLFAWRSRRSRFEAMEDLLNEQIERQNRKIDSQANALAILGERVLALEEYLELVGSRQQQLEGDKRDVRYYQRAVKLAGEGGKVADLVERCGMSRAEAELIVSLGSKSAV